MQAQAHTHTEGRRERCTGRTRNSRKITILDIPRHTSSDTQTTICGLVVGVSFLFFFVLFLLLAAAESLYMQESVCGYENTDGLVYTRGGGDEKSQRGGKSQGTLAPMGSPYAACLTLPHARCQPRSADECASHTNAVALRRRFLSEITRSGLLEHCSGRGDGRRHVHARVSPLVANGVFQVEAGSWV